MRICHAGPECTRDVGKGECVHVHRAGAGCIDVKDIVGDRQESRVEVLCRLDNERAGLRKINARASEALRTEPLGAVVVDDNIDGARVVIRPDPEPCPSPIGAFTLPKLW